MSKFSTALKISGSLAALVVAVLGIWQVLIKPTGRLVAEVHTVTAPLSYEREMQIRNLAKVTSKELRDTSGGKVSVECLNSALPLFSKFLETRASSILEDWGIVPTNEVMVATVKNRGDATLEEVQLRLRLGSKEYVTIERENAEPEHREVKNVIDIGRLKPREEVVITRWSIIRVVDSPDYVEVTHREGIGQVWFYRAVPPLIAGGGGIWLSYLWTSIVLAAALALLLGLWAYQRRRRNAAAVSDRSAQS